MSLPFVRRCIHPVDAFHGSIPEAIGELVMLNTLNMSQNCERPCNLGYSLSTTTSTFRVQIETNFRLDYLRG
uniref:Uncharacterized protein n=1 Tax=Oryza barthii TaxID=65489 RepID=A0A0D3EJW2_9ORYZ